MNPSLYTIFTSLDQLIAAQRAYYRNPAMALAVTDERQLLHRGIYGLTSLETASPVTPQTLFEIGSIGKVFTAIALLQAQEAGLLSLHEPVTRYLPWFAVQSRFEPITLHHLMTHSAGIVAGMDARTDARAEVYLLRETEAANPPGAFFHYSNVGYKVLGLALEAVYHKPYEQIIREGIFAPLGMANSSAVITHAERQHMPRGLVPRFDDRPYHRSQPLEPAPWVETNTGDGCIASTAEDMACLARALLNGGQGLLSPASFDLLTHPWMRVDEHTEYGYGLFLIQREGRRYIGHGGDMPGFEAGLFLDPEMKTGVVLLMATPHVPRLSMYILDSLRATCLQQPLPPRPGLPNPAVVADPSQYVGEFQNRISRLTFEACAQALYVLHGDERIPLEAQSADRFYTPHPAFSRHPFIFSRQDEKVIGVQHGDEDFHLLPHPELTPGEPPAEWRAYCGHYRAHNPWLSNFRILIRKGRLWLSWGTGEEYPLAPLGEHTFRVEDDLESPERLRFEWPVEGRFLQAWYSGGTYDLFFTE